jgi:hypothetical protein
MKLDLDDVRLAALRERLVMIKQKPFGDLYRAFEILQQLDYAKEGTCDNPDCPGIGADGVVIGIKTRKMFIDRTNWETSQVSPGPKLPSFPEHAFLSDEETRILLRGYTIDVAYKRDGLTRQEVSCQLLHVMSSRLCCDTGLESADLDRLRGKLAETRNGEIILALIEVVPVGQKRNSEVHCH